MSMISQARRNPKIYDDLRGLGYADEEFPEWWYSPARPPEKKQDATRIEPEETRTTQDETRTPESDEEHLTAPGPKSPVAPVPKERVSRRPALPALLESGLDSSTDLESGLGSSDGGLTASEINLLGSRGIVRGQDGVWVHIEKESSSRTIIARER